MTSATAYNNSSTLRAEKFRVNMIKRGFKRVQKWVLNIESVFTQEQIRQDLANYCHTHETKELDDFSVQQLHNIKGWE